MLNVWESRGFRMLFLFEDIVSFCVDPDSVFRCEAQFRIIRLKITIIVYFSYLMKNVKCKHLGSDKVLFIIFEYLIVILSSTEHSHTKQWAITMKCFLVFTSGKMNDHIYQLISFFLRELLMALWFTAKTDLLTGLYIFSVIFSGLYTSHILID